VLTHARDATTYLDKHFVFSHLLDNLAHVRGWLLQQRKLLAQTTNYIVAHTRERQHPVQPDGQPCHTFRVQLIALSLQAAKILLPLSQSQLQPVQLRLVIGRDATIGVAADDYFFGGHWRLCKQQWDTSLS